VLEDCPVGVRSDAALGELMSENIHGDLYEHLR
jgi:hypothetical protein